MEPDEDKVNRSGKLVLVVVEDVEVSESDEEFDTDTRGGTLEDTELDESGGSIHETD